MAATEVPSSRRWIRAGVAAVLIPVALSGGVWAAVRGGLLGRSAAPPAPASVPTATATVIHTDVVQRQPVQGTLGYDGSFTVIPPAPGGPAGGPTSPQGGILTRLPVPGAVLTRGQALYEVDGHAVPLWYGVRPAWRAFQSGMTDGQDVNELERNLVALGFDPDRAITVDEHFTWATRAAIRRWQHDVLGLPPAQRSGEIPLGGAVFLPGPIRVASVTTSPGTPVQAGTPILTATSTRVVVAVALDPGLQQFVRPGNRVLVSLPDGRTTPGSVSTVGRVAVVAGGAGQGQGQSGNDQGGNGPARPTIPVTVGLSDPRAASGLDQAPVQVAITTQAHRGVLAAPINALVARPGGGYAVTVLSGASGRRVPVRTGLFDETTGLVEVSGPGVSRGTVVEVPAP
jgi:Putative peptidoglycan binding domain/HlyD family secretion protein